MGISGLGEVGSILYRDGVTEKGSTIDNNHIGSTSLEMSNLEGIGSSLRCEGHLPRCGGTSKGSPACFCVKSSILL